MKVHYTEKFFSLQGEGRYFGVPSVFLRMFGCNFRCKNFGRTGDQKVSSDEYNPEVIQIIKDLDQYKKFEDLPLVQTGCDSYSSVYPEFKRFANKETTDDLALGIVNLLPYKEWRDEHLVITGGEPLLGWQRAYSELLEHDVMRNLKELTFETNGTQELTESFKSYLIDWGIEKRGYNSLTFSVSPKLSCSGETRLDAIKPKIVVDYESFGYTYLKFVVATNEDVDEALETITVYRHHGFKGPVYLMPEGGTEVGQNLNRRRVAELAMANGLRYSGRLQVDLWKNAWGT
jgi:organic radical activating enzyme